MKHPETTQLYGPNTDKDGAIEVQPGWSRMSSGPAFSLAGEYTSTEV